MEATVFSRFEIREILNRFVFVDLHLDGAPVTISESLRKKNADLALLYAKNTGMPIYVVLNPHDRQVMSVWGWEGADPKRWKRLLDDVLMRWRNLRPNQPPPPPPPR